MDTTTSTETVRENHVAGAVGAFLFALVGGVVYFLLWQLQFLSAISGLIAIACAMKGYQLFAKKESKVGTIISVIMSMIVIVIAWYLCLSFDVYQAFREWYAAGEINYTITFLDAMFGSYLFLGDPQVAGGYLASLVIGLLLCALGCISPIRNAVFRMNAGARQKPAPAKAPVVTEKPATPAAVEEPVTAEEPAVDEEAVAVEESAEPHPETVPDEEKDTEEA